MGTLPHGLSTKPGILGLSDGLHLDSHSQGTLLLVEHTTTAYLVCQSDSHRLDSHSHGNITRWVGHAIRLLRLSIGCSPLTWEHYCVLSTQPGILGLSIRQSSSRQPRGTHMGALPCGLSTKPNILGLSDSLHLDSHSQGTLLLDEHTTTAYLVCQSGHF